MESELEKSLEEKRILKQQQYRSQKITECVGYLREYYKNDRDPVPSPEFSPLNQITSKEEIRLLDEELQFTSAKADVIGKLFIDGSKPNFLKFICHQDTVKIDLKEVIIGRETVLEKLLYIENDLLFERLITLLFRSGHSLSERDHAAVEKLFEKNEFNTSESERKYIERWALVKCFSGLWHKEHATLISLIKKPLYGLMSLKYGMPIGYNFSNLRQLTMNFLEFHKDFSAIYIKAMKHYGQDQKQLNEDRNGKLKSKMDKFASFPPTQNYEYTIIFSELFPEL